MAMKRPQIEILWPPERPLWGLDPAGEGLWSFSFDHQLAPPGTRIELAADGQLELIGPLAGCWCSIPATSILSDSERPGFDRASLQTHVKNAHIVTHSQKLSDWCEYSSEACNSELADECLRSLLDGEEEQ